MANKLPITLACWDYDRMAALQDGRVQPEGIELNYVPLMMPEPAFRMLHHGEFDAAEMSLSWYTRTVALDDRPFVAIPVFPSRMFRHGNVYVNAKSGIEKPEDLRGKRIGTPEYQMTAVVWLKGIMADRHDVPIDSVQYFTGGLEQPGRTESPMELPASISLTPIGPERTLNQMLADGEIDALYTAHAPSSFGDGSGRVVRLWKDPRPVEEEYYRDTKIFPIMHVIVVRKDVHEKNPWVAQSLVKAFDASKKLAIKELHETTALKYMLPWLTTEAERTQELLGDDPFAYGLEPNRHVLDTFLRYSHEQHLSPRRITPDEMFAPSTIKVTRI